MTGSAERTKLTGVRIIFGVAGCAVHGRTFELSVLMAALTGNRGMFPVKFERELRVIHRCRLPAIGRMTSSTQGTKSAIMCIVFCMTRGAILRRAFEDAVLMATLTGNRGMFPIQMERELRVVDCCRFPSSRQMTGCAIGSKLTVMMVIFLVTGDTRLRSGFQVSEAARTSMTCRTFRKDVFPV